ncbi:adenine phosphoribosyltransferase [Peptoniphilus sp. KCTC 25270]|uniref:adenine phosphoribosyltransferase n=1 Tax=Peptoniphilus sp. KCTC 25270 TaxID=2897414 RepID=UPI001E28D610|nr:adenine phosphoribosyltransferase [Peptoniphilus sp. KCTC 25270]MCD1147639.1 adenine phosphoribosyltransferase [Peptoniphilus sp. KCTC 25270]
MDLKQAIRSIENYPIEGVTFRDITPVLQDADTFRDAIDQLAKAVKDLEIDKVVGIEARGFIVGAPLSLALDCGFIPIRKPGKLPFHKIKEEYDLEYGTDAIEIHEDAIEKGEKILIVDDLLATGGTSKAAANLIEKIGGKISGFLFLIELDDLGGRKKLEGYEVRSLLHYE